MKKERMDSLSLLIKPASGLCNLKCDYCFYREEVSRLQDFHQKVMSDETMELLIQRAFESTRSRVQFSFQGGEPTMAGLDYFRKFTDLAEKRMNSQAGREEGKENDEGKKMDIKSQKKGKRPEVSYAFQTNGILLDQDWTALFRKHHFLVGLSFDGTDQLHDRYRRGAGGEKTAAQVKAAWELLCEETIDTNILCVVTAPMARRPEKVYRYLKNMGAGFWQFIPCMESADQALQTPDWALAPKDYAYFLKGMFDLWYQDWKSGHYISIRNFDDTIHLLCGQGVSTCAACGECGGYLVVENDGSVYPCDFYVEDSWCLGNIRDSSFDELRYGDKMREFLDETKNLHQNSRCLACEYYRLCKGGCKHDWSQAPDMEGAGHSDRVNIFCEAYQDFFYYAMPRMLEIAQVEMRYLTRC